MPNPAQNGGSLREAGAERMWLELYRKAVADLASGKPGFTALFSGNEFDLGITFRRYPKGSIGKPSVAPTERIPE